MQYRATLLSIFIFFNNDLLSGPLDGFRSELKPFSITRNWLERKNKSENFFADKRVLNMIFHNLILENNSLGNSHCQAQRTQCLDFIVRHKNLRTGLINFLEYDFAAFNFSDLSSEESIVQQISMWTCWFQFCSNYLAFFKIEEVLRIMEMRVKFQVYWVKVSVKYQLDFSKFSARDQLVEVENKTLSLGQYLINNHWKKVAAYVCANESLAFKWLFSRALIYPYSNHKISEIMKMLEDKVGVNFFTPPSENLSENSLKGMVKFYTNLNYHRMCAQIKLNSLNRI